MDFARIKKVRATKRAAFTKALNAFNEKRNATAALKDIEVAFQLLEEKTDDLSVTSNECLEAMYDTNATEEDIQKESDETDDYRHKFLEARSAMQEITKVQKGAVEDSDSVSGVTVVSRQQYEVEKSFKLPKIELAKFNGSIRDWLQFWSLFKKIDKNSKIDNEHKFQYLLQAMVPGSRAAELVKSYPPSEENYSKVIESLKNRFGRDDLLIEVYVRDLLQLVLNSGVRSTVQLSSLYDKIESYLRALDTLGVTADKYATMLFPLVESCLPEDLLRAWQRCCAVTGRMNNEGTESTEAKDRLNRLIGFLEDEVRNELRISMATEKFGFTSKSDKIDNKPQKSTEQAPKRNVPSATNLLAASETKCLFCDSNHESENCKKAASWTLEKRKEFAKSKGACLDCLIIGHIYI